MKNILSFSLVFLGLCSCSRYYIPEQTNLPFDSKHLNNKLRNIEGLMVSTTNPITFYQNPTLTSNKDIRGGKVIQNSQKNGLILEQPTKVPVIYYKGPKKGQKVFDKKTKGYINTEYLGMISKGILNTENILETAYLGIKNDSLNVAMPYMPVVASVKEDKLGNPIYNYVYQIALVLATAENEGLYPGLKISKEGYYYQEVSEKKFFVVKDDNENLWYIEPQDAKARIRSFLLKTNSEDNTKKGVAETERFGDDP